MLTREPTPLLRPFVKMLWVATRPTTLRPVGTLRERVLPTGEMHLVFRLADRPLRLYANPTDPRGRTIAHAVVGGVRDTYYLRDVSDGGGSVGAQLHPGAARALFGTPADALAGRHTPLADLWGRDADDWRERVATAPSTDAQLDLLEAALAARLSAIRGVHPAVAQALARFRDGSRVDAAVAASGYSHRRFIELFRHDMGVVPTTHRRLRRFNAVLARIDGDPRATWTNVALDAGYADQAHLTREFREFTGLTPGEYRRLAPAAAHHVPLTPPSR